MNKNPNDPTLCGCDASTDSRMSYSWCRNKATHLAQTKANTQVLACDEHVSAWEGGYFVQVSKLEAANT